MTSGAFLESIVDRMEDLVERVQVLSHDVDDRSLNLKPDSKRLSMGQIFEHMILGAQEYVANTRSALQSSTREGVEREFNHTWFGKFIIKAAGPKGSAPMPKALVPGPGPFRKEIIDRWVALHQEIIDLAKRSRGYDLSSIPMRSPIIKLFSMNLADVFEILTAHAERHVGQIEALVRESPRPKEPAGV
jgi:hypothetical protein